MRPDRGCGSHAVVAGLADSVGALNPGPLIERDGRRVSRVGGGAEGELPKIAEGAGTFPVDGPLFTFLLIGVILIVGALTYFPVLSLGPYVEHFLMNAGKVF